MNAIIDCPCAPFLVDEVMSPSEEGLACWRKHSCTAVVGNTGPVHLAASHVRRVGVCIDRAGAGVLSTRATTLQQGLRDLMTDPALARETGLQARQAALARYGLARFLDDWDRLLKEWI